MINTSISTISLQETGYFSNLMLDYISGKDTLDKFYSFSMDDAGLEKALIAKQQQNFNRSVLVEVLKEQYHILDTTELVKQNIEALLSEDSYTVCTAHQPSLFTGNLYFIYKIAQTVSLAKSLALKHPNKKFIPIFWMGSEDADLDELGYVYLNGETIRWNTTQTGAVGRMNNKGIDTLIQRLENELIVQPFGKELIALLRSCYLPNENFQQATFRLINALFQEWGVVVLIPDHPLLKREMIPVFSDDLLNQTPSEIVANTISEIPEQYKIQANPRSVNLFYLVDGIRNLIVFENNQYWIKGTDIVFSQEELISQLEQSPERFSPNVILRGLFQETILPNVATIGGGGETAYWLELKGLFDHYKIVYPVLVLRNSYLWMNIDQVKLQNKYSITNKELFLPTQQLYGCLMGKQNSKDLTTTEEQASIKTIFENLLDKAEQVDQSLIDHIKSIEVNLQKKLAALEHKLFRAERQRYESLNRKVGKLKAELFPKNGLQERVENFLPFYAKYGKAFVDTIVENSPALSKEFIIIKEETE